MSMSDSWSLSWARQPMLWIQVSTFLRHARLGDETIEKIKVNLFNQKYLDSVTISAIDTDGLCVTKFVLNIDWVRHEALLSKKAVVERFLFDDNRNAYGLEEFVKMMEEYFANTGNRRGWGFGSSIDFHYACSIVGVIAGGPTPDHPNLRRVRGLAIPGLEEAVMEVWTID